MIIIIIIIVLFPGSASVQSPARDARDPPSWTQTQPQFIGLLLGLELTVSEAEACRAGARCRAGAGQVLGAGAGQVPGWGRGGVEQVAFILRDSPAIASAACARERPRGFFFQKDWINIRKNSGKEADIFQMSGTISARAFPTACSLLCQFDGRGSQGAVSGRRGR